MFHNRRAIFKSTKPQTNVLPFDVNKKLNKGFRYVGNGEVKDSTGNVYNISDYK